MEFPRLEARTLSKYQLVEEYASGLAGMAALECRISKMKRNMEKLRSSASVVRLPALVF